MDLQNEVLTKSAEEQLFELGQVLGARRAFGLVAGRCSAADAACLKRMRNEKLFKIRAETWDEFCTRYLRLSKTHADRIIRYLDEFGPGFFELGQLIRITPREFREIAPSVKDGSLHADGEAIALVPANTEKIEAALETMRQAAAPPQKPGALETLGRHCRQLTAEFQKILSDKEIDQQTLCSLLEQTMLDLRRIGLMLGQS